MDNILNSPITIEEIKNVVKGLKNGKSSGIILLMVWLMNILSIQ
jgi:hypothetical protein